MSDFFVHPTAIVEPEVVIGAGSSIWDHVHVRRRTRIGRRCIVGGKTYIAYDVVIGDLVKINSFVYICTGVVIETGVMIGAGTIFTNDRFPRAATPDLRELQTSEPTADTLPTVVQRGASIGAGCVIGCGLEIGPFAMVGMGAVVTRTVPAFHLTYGHPAQSCGCVCRCGQPLVRWEHAADINAPHVLCPHCEAQYEIRAGEVRELRLGAGAAEPGVAREPPQ